MKKEDKKQAWILCPRCELNYIKSKDKYCTVCKAEMGLVDPSILLPDEEEVGLEKLCPICQVNYIGEDEEVCFLCQKEREEREAAENKSEWDDIDRENTDELGSPIGILPLDDDPILSDDDETEEEEEESHKEDDFDYPPLEDLGSLDDYEDDEEDEDEDFEDEDL